MKRYLEYDLQWFAKDGPGGEKTEPATAKKLRDAREEGKPVCIIANTIKGKGLACAENQAGWHHKTPSLEQVEQLKEDMAEYRKELA